MVKNKFENNRSTDRLKLLFFQFAPVIIDTKIRSFDAQLHCKWVTKPFFSTSFLTSFRQVLVMWHSSLYLSYLSICLLVLCKLCKCMIWQNQTLIKSLIKSFMSILLKSFPKFSQGHWTMNLFFLCFLFLLS